MSTARRTAGWAWAVLAAGLLAAACTTQAPIVPYPDVAYVPHPLRLPAGPAGEDLVERYNVSPNRNPDGLGVLDTIWLNSRMSLVTWQTAQANEARNRIAYARSPEEQATALARARELYQGHWVFEGLLLGYLSEFVDPRFYEPEGIYIVDDRGRKFLPEAVQTIDQPGVPVQRTPQGDVAHYGHPRLVFPPETITAQTRAVSLYLAAYGTRLRFTWVFDPGYDLPPGGLGPGSGRERNRLFPAP